MGDMATTDELERPQTAPVEQFYETKLFRVILARKSLAQGHAIIERKLKDPHYYSLTLDELEELSYLTKKVSFWSMRYTMATGFTMMVNDGTPETMESDALRVHIIPRPPAEVSIAPIMQELLALATELNDADITKQVQELQATMQLPQDNNS